MAYNSRHTPKNSLMNKGYQIIIWPNSADTYFLHLPASSFLYNYTANVTFLKPDMDI